MTQLEQDGFAVRGAAPLHACRLNISAITRLDRALTPSGFAIKYVAEGVERYTVEGHAHVVRAGQYLLANQTVAMRAGIESEHPVKGLCIDLAPALLAGVLQGIQRPEDFTEAGEEAGPFCAAEYPEAVHGARYTGLGPLLHRMATTFFADPAALDRLNAGHYYELAEHVVRDHAALWPRFAALPAVRTGTRKDLYRRVQRAKALLDADPTATLPVAELAREAAMSEYHFFRAFRLVEGITPHQYRLRRRLGLGHALLAQGQGTLHDVAVRTGFADAAAFSKAFRQHFGRTPGHVLRGA